MFIILAVIINATYPDTCLNYDSFSLFEIIFACQIFHVVVMTFRAIYASFLPVAPVAQAAPVASVL